MAKDTWVGIQRDDLAVQYREVRARTEELCMPLAVDDYQVQSVVDASPPKWHLAHVSWFFETFLLNPFAREYQPFHPLFAKLFNSYYESVGEYHPRGQRHTLSRPTVDQVYRYRAHVDEQMLELIETASEEFWPSILQRTLLGLYHEQQHQELLLIDVKRNFFSNPLYPAYIPTTTSPVASAAPFHWLSFRGGLKEIGHDGHGFGFDNEMPRHKMFLGHYRLSSRLIINAEYLEFVEHGGYSQAQYWLSDGWRVAREQGWQAPLYWIKIDGGWHEFMLRGFAPLNPAAPVCHVSFYEADAFARWCGARLPTEAELEAASAAILVEGNFVESGLLHPRPALDESDRQWFGDLWEWTASAYAPYPGYRPMEGALGEYNGKFMVNQFVLRGGCCATPKAHMRATYRNFFYPQDRWPFTGIRLALDGTA